ncbi:MAG: hypothetical protein NTY64_23815 [Deltaproteobacteria bacterium]|nr:hypothetical protein [Deltaproteobacteria bacterium]
METTAKDTKATAVQEEKRKKRSWGKMIMNFMMMGGFLVVLVLIAGIMILVSYLMK